MSKGVTLFLANVPWAPLAHHGCPSPFSNTKLHPQGNPKLQPGAQHHSKKRSRRTPKVEKVTRHIWDTGPADCAKRLQSARPLLLAKGSRGVLRPEARFFLVFNPSKSLPSSSAHSALPFILCTPLVTFFSVPYGAHKFTKIYHILHPRSSKNDT